MKKDAYTLAEVLVAVGIVGVIAAVMLPLANKYKPDKNKVLYLKTYDAITQAVNDLTKNATVYPLTDGEFDYTKAPLSNWNSTTVSGITLPEGESKFCAALANSLNAKVNKCNENDADKRYFLLDNGVQVKVNRFNITVDLDGEDNGSDCEYSETCKHPDIFYFEVARNGFVAVRDVAGMYYKKTRSNWKSTSDIVPFAIEDIAIWNEDKAIKLPEEPKAPEEPESLKGGGGDDGIIETPGDNNDDQSSGGTDGQPDDPNPYAPDYGSGSDGDNEGDGSVSGSGSGGSDPCEGQGADDLWSTGLDGQCQGSWYGYKF